MSQSILYFWFKKNGELIDPTSVVLEDITDTYGVRRQDNSDIVVASGTPAVKDRVGEYSITFTDPALDLIYEYVFKVVYDGNTQYCSGTAPGKKTLPDITMEISSITFM